MTQSFSHRHARSTPIILTLSVLVILETVGIHLLLLRYSLILAIVVSLLSVSSLIWLVADFIALGRVTTVLTDEDFILRVGRRASATIPRKLVADAVAPSWKDVPDGPDKFYLNATKPAEPNVLLRFNEPVLVKLPGGLRRRIKRLALFVDNPERFLTAVQGNS